MSYEPKSLQEAVVYFSNPDNCVAHLVAQRWPDGVVKCPNCGNENVSLQGAPPDLDLLQPSRET